SEGPRRSATTWLAETESADRNGSATSLDLRDGGPGTCPQPEECRAFAKSPRWWSRRLGSIMAIIWSSRYSAEATLPDNASAIENPAGATVGGLPLFHSFGAV